VSILLYVEDVDVALTSMRPAQSSAASEGRVLRRSIRQPRRSVRPCLTIATHKEDVSPEEIKSAS
jgi:hypothetical protein